MTDYCLFSEMRSGLPITCALWGGMGTEFENNIKKVSRYNRGQRKLGISDELYTADRSSSTMLVTEETKALWLSKATQFCSQFQQLQMPAIYSPCSLYIVGGR